jgi:hypothetical protein
MKRIVLKLVLAVSDIWYKLRFRIALSRIQRDKHIYFVDIDNTLADTWPTLNPRNHSSERERMNSLAIFMGMRSFILNLMKDEKNKIIFLTARNILAHPVTFEWLKKNGIEVGFADIIVVSSAGQKIGYIRRAQGKKYAITYIDDLSYNHEHGNMKLYEAVISSVNDLKVAYLGLEEITRINTDYLNKYDN